MFFRQKNVQPPSHEDFLKLEKFLADHPLPGTAKESKQHRKTFMGIWQLIMNDSQLGAKKTSLLWAVMYFGFSITKIENYLGPGMVPHPVPHEIAAIILEKRAHYNLIELYRMLKDLKKYCAEIPRKDILEATGIMKDVLLVKIKDAIEYYSLNENEQISKFALALLIYNNAQTKPRARL